MGERLSVSVRDNAEQQRFEAVDEEGNVAGLVVYQREGDRVVLVHTEVGDAYEGRGVGSTLAREVLDGLRREGAHVAVVCPFIAAYVERHPEYQDLVSP